MLGRAKRSKDLAQVALLLQIANPFEKMIVYGSVYVFVFGIVKMLVQSRPLFQAGNYRLPTSIALFPTTLAFVPTVFIPRGKRFERTLEEARQGGEITTELKEAFDDGAVAIARNYEFVVIGLIFALHRVEAVLKRPANMPCRASSCKSRLPVGARERPGPSC